MRTAMYGRPWLNDTAPTLTQIDEDSDLLYPVIKFYQKVKAIIQLPRALFVTLSKALYLRFRTVIVPPDELAVAATN